MSGCNIKQKLDLFLRTPRLITNAGIEPEVSNLSITSLWRFVAELEYAGEFHSPELFQLLLNIIGGKKGEGGIFNQNC